MLRKFFVCKRCLGAISNPWHYSNDSEYCDICYEEKKHIEKGICVSCKKEKPIKEFWGNCVDCWTKDMSEEEAKEHKEYVEGLK